MDGFPNFDNPYTILVESKVNHIIKGLRSGLESAYRELYEDYYSKLVMFARKYLDDMDAARDLVQDFFAHLYETRESISIQTSLKSYLYSSVRNRCLNYLKHLQTRDKHREEAQAEGNGFDPKMEDEIDASELEIKIHRIVSELPEQCRRIYSMSRVDEKSNSEIADELGLSIRTVETQISKALKVLRDNLLPLHD